MNKSLDFKQLLNGGKSKLRDNTNYYTFVLYQLGKKLGWQPSEIKAMSEEEIKDVLIIIGIENTLQEKRQEQEKKKANKKPGKKQKKK